MFATTRAEDPAVILGGSSACRRQISAAWAQEFSRPTHRPKTGSGRLLDLRDDSQQSNAEGRASFGRRAHFNAPSLGEHDLPGDEETQTQARAWPLVGFGLGLRHLHQGIEDDLKCFWRMGAAVLNDQPHGVVLLPDGQEDR